MFQSITDVTIYSLSLSWSTLFNFNKVLHESGGDDDKKYTMMEQYIPQTRYSDHECAFDAKETGLIYINQRVICRWKKVYSEVIALCG